MASRNFHFHTHSHHNWDNRYKPPILLSTTRHLHEHPAGSTWERLHHHGKIEKLERTSTFIRSK